MPDKRIFHQELDHVRADIVRMAAMATEFIPRATEVLLTTDLHGAQLLIEADDVLDDMTLELEERCYQILALQQPVAIDLRGIITAIRLTSEIERSADLMVNVAKAARRLYGAEFEPRVRGLIEQMSEEATRLFKLAIDAYDDGNAGLAAALDDMDDRLDSLHKEFIQSIFESHHGTTLALQPAVQLALVGRYYERVGDHAVNIGHRVQYMVTGWMPEHAGAARAQARRQQADGEADAATATAEARDGDVPSLRLAPPPDGAEAGGG
ncbi:MAG: phosphate signaling complex protein PhoU [Actinobacteria bacterium]|nr:phosphate signaling complex protein PhoU [Actinomycetota bacterium]